MFVLFSAADESGQFIISDGNNEFEQIVLTASKKILVLNDIRKTCKLFYSFLLR